MKRTKSFLTSFICAGLMLFSSGMNAAKSIEAVDLTCEYFSNPMGIGTTAPRLSWILTSGLEDQVQTAYQVLVASSPKMLNEKKADRWNSLFLIQHFMGRSHQDLVGCLHLVLNPGRKYPG